MTRRVRVMSRTGTETRIKAIIVEHLAVSEADIVDDVRLMPERDVDGNVKRDSAPNLNADSLDLVELVMSFEEEFGVDLPDDEVAPERIVTFKDLVDLIDAKVEASGLNREGGASRPAGPSGVPA
jgi:acyl carrier protein